MVHDDGPVGLDGVGVRFDDERAVANAGIVLVVTLVARLGIEALVERCVGLGARAGAANPGRKLLALVYAMALGADSIDDCDVLRSGATDRLLGGAVAAPSTLGTFLRAFTFGHVRQLDRVLAETLRRAWAAGAGPGGRRLVIDVDSFVGAVHGYHKQGAAFGYTLDQHGDVLRADIHHPPWPLRPAEASFEHNTMAAPYGLDLDAPPALLHFARRQDVLIWPLARRP